MNWSRTGSSVISSAAIALVTAPGPAQDTDPPAPAQINNYQHPADTETTPLGTLGHIEKRGNGPVDLILLPGAGFGWSVWETFMARNADRYTMYAITPPGNDGTKPPPMPENPENFASHTWTNGLLDGIVKLINNEKLDRPIVVGHHLLGDHHALRMGLEHPELIRSVIVVTGSPTRLGETVQDAASAQLTTTDQQQIDAVERHWLAFYKTMTRDDWLSGAYKPFVLATDEDRGAALYEQQIATPFPTQIRYYLEFMTTNLSNRLSDLQVPLLVVYPLLDPDVAREALRRQFVAQLGDEDDAERRLQIVIDKVFGGKEAFEQRVSKNELWEALRPKMSNLTVEYIPDTQIFIMDDQPDKLDELIEAFIKRISAASIE
ncbi:MAG: alpha/beta hydrolase [Phycisphaerales bacterium]